MTAKLIRRQQGVPKGRMKAPPPVKGKSELFVSEESIGHVENFFEPSDTDRENKIRKIEAEAPTLGPDVDWYGDGSSDRE
jgi:hypothetical protein